MRHRERREGKSPVGPPERRVPEAVRASDQKRHARKRVNGHLLEVAREPRRRPRRAVTSQGDDPDAGGNSLEEPLGFRIANLPRGFSTRRAFFPHLEDVETPVPSRAPLVLVERRPGSCAHRHGRVILRGGADRGLDLHILDLVPGARQPRAVPFDSRCPSRRHIIRHHVSAGFGHGTSASRRPMIRSAPSSRRSSCSRTQSSSSDATASSLTASLAVVTIARPRARSTIRSTSCEA